MLYQTIIDFEIIYSIAKANGLFGPFLQLTSHSLLEIHFFLGFCDNAFIFSPVCPGFFSLLLASFPQLKLELLASLRALPYAFYSFSLCQLILSHTFAYFLYAHGSQTSICRPHCSFEHLIENLNLPFSLSFLPTLIPGAVLSIALPCSASYSSLKCRHPSLKLLQV